MRKTRAYFFAWLAIVALAVSLSPDCFAFKSGYIYEKIHENIIRQALDSTGIVAKSLQTVINGADSQDDIKSKKFTDSPTHHFDDCLLNESIAYFQDRFSKAVGYSSYKSYQHYGSTEQQLSIKNTLYTFGEGLHTIQDFYSHSNYVEMLAANGNKDELVDWKALPAGIKTGYFYWNGYTDNESTRSRAISVKNISNHYKEKGSLLTFHSEADWKVRKENPTFERSTQYVLNPQYQCLHLELNKDDANQTAGSVKLPDGRTMHAKARALAILETKRQWNLFLNAIKEKFKKRSQLIIPALMGYDVPEIKLKVRMPARANAGKAIPLDCSVSLKNSYIDEQLQRRNPEKYDLVVKATVYKDSQKEAEVENDLDDRSVGGTGGIAFELPPLTGDGERLVKVKVSFAGDPRFNPIRKQMALTIGRESLVNSKWLIQGDFGSKEGIKKYDVTVMEDSPTSFKVNVMGRRKGDTLAIFSGTRQGSNISLVGRRQFRAKKIVGSNGSLDGLNAGRVVDGPIQHQTFDVAATLYSDETKVNVLIKKMKFSGSRIK